MPASNIIFMDGFDTYSTADNIINKWHTNISNQSFTIGRYGGKALRIGSSLDSTYRSFNNNQFICVSFAVQFSALSGIPGDPFCALLDGNTQVDLRVNTNGILQITRNGSMLTNGVSTSSVRINTWYWMEWKMMIADSISANTCQLTVNDQLFINVAAGQDTKLSGNSYANEIALSTNVAAFATSFDDFVLQVGSGSDFLGDTRICTAFPSGNGSSSNWLGSDSNSTDNYQLIDEIVSDSDSSYVESSAAGSKDLYSFPPLEVQTNSVTAIEFDINCRKVDTGSKTLCSVIKSGATEQDGSNKYLSDTYHAHIEEMYPINPDTGSAWTQAQIAAVEFGQKLTS